MLNYEEVPLGCGRVHIANENGFQTYEMSNAAVQMISSDNLFSFLLLLLGRPGEGARHHGQETEQRREDSGAVETEMKARAQGYVEPKSQATYLPAHRPPDGD